MISDVICPVVAFKRTKRISFEAVIPPETVRKGVRALCSTRMAPADSTSHARELYTRVSFVHATASLSEDWPICLSGCDPSTSALKSETTVPASTLIRTRRIPWMNGVGCTSSWHHTRPEVGGTNPSRCCLMLCAAVADRLGFDAPLRERRPTGTLASLSSLDVRSRER